MIIESSICIRTHPPGDLSPRFSPAHIIFLHLAFSLFVRISVSHLSRSFVLRQLPPDTQHWNKQPHAQLLGPAALVRRDVAHLLLPKHNVRGLFVLSVLSDFPILSLSRTHTLFLNFAAAPTHNIGINIPMHNYWDQLHWFVEMSPAFCFRNTTSWGPPSMDALGWPQNDFRVILTLSPEPAGEYTIRFTGNAASITLDSGGKGVFVNQHYDNDTNTYSCVLNMTTPMSGLTSLIIKGTKRRPTDANRDGTGVTNLRVYR